MELLTFYPVINLDEASGKRSLWKIPVNKSEEKIMILHDFLKKIKANLSESEFIHEKIKILGAFFFEGNLDYNKKISYYKDCLPFYSSSYCSNQELEISIVTIKNKIICSLKVIPEETIAELKLKIEKKIPMDVQSSSLKLTPFDETLEDSVKLKDVEIWNKGRLTLIPAQIYKIKLIIYPDKFKRTLEMTSNKSTEDLKKEIYKEFKIPPENQRFCFPDFDEEVIEYLDDNRKIDELVFSDKKTIKIVVYQPFSKYGFVKIKNQKIKIKPDYLVLDLKKKVEKKLKISISDQILKLKQNVPEFWLQILSNYQKLSYYDYSCIPKLKLIHKKELGNIQILIKLIEGEEIPLYVKASDYIESIKARLNYSVGLAPEDIRLIYNGKELENGRTVLDYNISDHSDIFATSCIQSVVLIKNSFNKFVEVSNNDGIKKKKLINSGPDWRKVSPGLILEGYCDNSACKAFGKEVFINKKFGSFDIIIDGKYSICPMCSQRIVIKNYAFNNSYYRISGLRILAETKIIERLHSKWEKVEDFYKSYDENCNEKEWINLKFHTRQIDKEQGYKDFQFLKPVCFVCNDVCQVKRSCGHYVHLYCLQNFYDEKGQKTNDCTLCIPF